MSSKTPMYDSTKEGFEQFEKEIDEFYDELDRKIEQAQKDAANWTEEKAKELQAYFERKIEAIKKKFQKDTENQQKKMEGANEKLEALKKIIELIMNPPSLDTIVTWAKSVADYYASQYTDVVYKVTDVAKTTAYIATETPVVAAKIANLPNALEKIEQLPDQINKIKNITSVIPK